MKSACFALLLVASFGFLPINSLAQVQTGTPPFGTFGGGLDKIDLANLNSHIVIPVLNKPGRGTNFTYNITYDTSVWQPVTSGSQKAWEPPLRDWGWQGVDALSPAEILMQSSIPIPCFANGIIGGQTGQRTTYGWSYLDPNATSHYFGVTEFVDGNCPGYSTTSIDATATDGSGYTLAANGSSFISLNDRYGNSLFPPINSQTPSSGPLIQDRNGNQISFNAGAYIDTLGTTVLTTSGTAPNPVTLTYNAPQNTTGTYTVKYKPYTVQTNFGCSGIIEFGPTSENLISEIDLPDGTKYSFAYEGTYGHAGNVTGRLASVTLPTGGMISYSYGNNGVNGINCVDGSAATLIRTTPDGMWTYTHTENGTAWSTTVTDPSPQHNQTIYDFQGIYQTERKVYNGSVGGTLLEDDVTCYNGNVSNCSNTAIALPITQRIVTKTVGNEECQHKYWYNSSGLVTQKDDYDYGFGAPGQPIRVALISYATLGNNIFDAPSQITIKNGSGGVVAQTSISYDQNPLGSSGAPQHVSVSGSRGNPTTVSYLVAGSSTLTKTFTYFDTGNVNVATDVNGEQTTFTYGACGDSFLTQTSITQPVNMSTSAAWDCNGGVPTSTTDQNNQPTTYAYDTMWRATQIKFPDGGETDYQYTDGSPSSLKTTSKLSASANAVTTALLDGLGRTKEVQLNSDPAGADYVDTTYDSLGRVASVSNPYRSTSDPTYGTTQYSYDALNRVTQVADPDSNIAQSSYSGNCVTLTDEQGKNRQMCSDSLGRLTQVTENPGGLGYQTSYSYDALGDLLTVTENGAAQRTFTYDGLGRMLSAANPESGTVTYAYDTNTKGDLASKKDARGITTTYTYDALHRLTLKQYSDGTPGVIYTYDVSNAFGISISNPIGRLVSEWRGVSGQWVSWRAFSFDSTGRVVGQWDNIPQSNSCNACLTSAQYDLAGDLTSLTYPDGRVVTQQFNAAAELNQVQFAAWGSTNIGYNYLGSASYAPNGAPTSLAFGNGLTETYGYNKRFQISSDELSSSALTALYRGYNFYDGSNHDNGNVMSVIDNLNSGRTQNFGYDALNRLASAQTQATSGADCWGQSYGYDAWGNLLQESATQCSSPTLSIGVTGNNQISGFGYDAAGNLTAQSGLSYQYDAEGRLVNFNNGAATYIYGASGERVQKTTGGASTEYIYFDGQPIAEQNLSTGDWSDYVYANGQRIARGDSFGYRLHTYGTNCSSCGWQWSEFWFPNAAGMNGYTIRSGDKMMWRQWQSSSASGGAALFFTDGTSTDFNVSDQDGYLTNEDGTHNTWHYRKIDLSSFAGKTVNGIALITEGTTPAGAWDEFYADMVVVSTDGKVQPIYNRETSISFSIGGSSGSTRSYEVNHYGSNGPYPQTSTTYYHSDQLGSARIMTTENGYPIWSGTYLPFGQEWNAQTTVNHYKFTSYERDAESGLDYALARHYTAQYGRFMQPDPYLGSANPANPQSWNRYAYVLNNPLSLTDPSGQDSLLGGPTCDESADPECLDPEPFSSAGSGGVGSSFGCSEFDWADSTSWCSQYAYNWFLNPNWMPFQISFTGTINGQSYQNATFDTWDDYFAWRTGIAAGAEDPCVFVGQNDTYTVNWTMDQKTCNNTAGGQWVPNGDNFVVLNGKVVFSPPTMRPAGTYGEYLACASNQWLSDPDRLKVIGLANVAAIGWGSVGQLGKAYTALAIAGSMEIGTALSIRRTCSREVYGR